LPDAPEGIATRHAADGRVVFLELLSADVVEIRPTEPGMPLQDAEEVSRLDGYVLSHVADEKDAGVSGLSRPQNRSPISVDCRLDSSMMIKEPRRSVSAASFVRKSSTVVAWAKPSLRSTSTADAVGAR
jgi:hypothetical protein